MSTLSRSKTESTWLGWLREHCKDNRSVKAAMHVSFSHERDMASQVRMLFTALDLCTREHWDGLTVQTLSGGLSNLLLRVIDTYSGTTFVVRSAGTRGVDAINRLEEFLTHVFLAEHGLVPSRPYGRFANGFVTDFVPGHSLDVSDFRPQAPEIAKTIAKWHAAPLDPAVKIPHIFFHASLWLARGRSVCQDPTEIDGLDFFEREIAFQQTILNDWKQEDIVLCHGDLLAGNIVLDDRTKRMALIDYEFSAPNHRAFDIANHFCEYAGMDGHYDDLPTAEERRDFVRNYLGDCATDSAVEALCVDIDRWHLMSHLFWGLWALVQSKGDPRRPFDYRAYSDIRKRQYLRERNPPLPSDADVGEQPLQ